MENNFPDKLYVYDESKDEINVLHFGDSIPIMSEIYEAQYLNEYFTIEVLNIDLEKDITYTCDGQKFYKELEEALEGRIKYLKFKIDQLNSFLQSTPMIRGKEYVVRKVR